MFLSMVVAAANNNVIGKDNQLVWNLPNDMKFFKNITWGMPVLMGRKTFEALGKPLKGRKNFVLTRNRDWQADGVVTVGSLGDAELLVKEMDVKELMIIGGAEIYKMLLGDTNRIYITRVNAEPEGDAFFPDIDPAVWKLTSRDDFPADAKHAYSYSFQVWERIVS
ncbi:MAG: dihydrofolate reductase [Chitinophagaceae bacterium]|nr:MAG: dihydrofolate reductase [Chitinophagaceae bacterium]